VTISFYVKGCRQEDVQVDLTDDGLTLNIVSPSPVVEVQLKPLYASIETSNSGIRVLSTKVEVLLQKKYPGNQWPKLLGTQLAATSADEIVQTGTASVAATQTQPPSASARPRSKWDSFKAEDEAADEGDINSFFQKLYADADDDTRRAMIKSYQESGGTTLSTNWQDVSKGKVETKPPDGMEARDWGK
jgi:suppressor of G2 allele of SKP1